MAVCPPTERLVPAVQTMQSNGCELRNLGSTIMPLAVDLVGLHAYL